MLIIGVAGCAPVESNNNSVEVEFRTSPVEHINGNVTATQIFREDNQPPLVIHIIKYNGHEYILARKNEAGGLTHSESCNGSHHKSTSTY